MAAVPKLRFLPMIHASHSVGSESKSQGLCRSPLPRSPRDRLGASMADGRARHGACARARAPCASRCHCQWWFKFKLQLGLRLSRRRLGIFKLPGPRRRQRGAGAFQVLGVWLLCACHCLYHSAGPGHTAQRAFRAPLGSAPGPPAFRAVCSSSSLAAAGSEPSQPQRPEVQVDTVPARS